MESIIAVVTWVINNVQVILEVIGAASVIATLTPNKVDDKIVQVLMDIINFLGQNYGKAKNADV